MAVGIVIVSHSAALADGVVELAREMGGEELAIEPAGGLEDGATGTDMERVLGAIERARSPEGVLVLMDLGSALMSAEMAVEMADPGAGPILLSEAPLVEGAVAAATTARVGGSLAEVAAEARAALRMKAEQLGEGPDEPLPEAEPVAEEPDGEELRVVVEPRLGLHARPVARFVVALAGLDAAVSVRNATRGGGPVNGRSQTELQRLRVRQGDELLVRASGPDAGAALGALRALAEANFGDPAEDAAAPQAPSAAGSAPPEPARTEEPAAGTRLRGVAASSGIAIGPARRLVRHAAEVAEEPAGPPDAEWARLQAAIASARGDLQAARADVGARASAAEADIFVAHLAMLEDPALLDPARREIDAGASAGRAWQAATDAAAAGYHESEDAFLRERAVDVEDVAARVLARLAGVSAAAGLDGPGILVAGELTPGDAAGLDPSQVRGIATARGGATAHAAILARALGIPAVVGLGPALLAVPEGTELALDGEEGAIDVAPDPAVLAERDARRREAEAAAAAALARAHEPAHTRDGTRLEVVANVGSAAEVGPALAKGAEGIGLLRTEFLFLDRAEPPDEEEQAAVLREIAAALEGRPLVVRTLDAGADKPLPFLAQPPEDNPFLGVRGIRLSLARPELFDAQLRAIVRVAAEHPLAVMFPMVGTLAELLAARERLDAARAAVGLEPELQVGVMVEVPGLALAAERFAPHVDFFSVGTNDLAQYTMAAERGSAALAELLEGPLPPVLALIGAVCEAAEARGCWVGVCGELAGDPDAAVLLTGLGVRELSMAAGRIPAVKAALGAIDLADAQRAARAAAGAADAREARALAEDAAGAGGT